MKKYIFITPEGLTYKPNFDSPEPDMPDLQMIGFGYGSTMEDALNDLMEINENLLENKPGQIFSLRLENDNRKSLWVKESRSKATMAS